MTEIYFRSSDPWLLQSIILSAKDGKSSLKDILAMGDALNKAMFTDAELKGGFARLIAAKYITDSDKYFVPSDEVVAAFDKIQKKHKTVSTQWDALSTLLGAEKWDPSYDCGWIDPVYNHPISNEELVQAEKAYRKEFDKKLRELKDRD